MYRVRIIFTSDLIGAWAECGGLSAHLNFLPIPVHIVATESISASLLYGGLISTRLEEMARSRTNRPAGLVDFAELLSNEHSRFKMQAVSQSKPAPTYPAAPKKEKDDKETRRAWLPKKEYMANLEAEKKTNDKTSSSSAAMSPMPSPSRARSRRRSRPGRSRSAKRRRRFPQPKRAAQRQRRRNWPPFPSFSSILGGLLSVWLKL